MSASDSRGRSSLFSYARYRTEDARLDAAIEDYTLREAGVVEDDEPTEYSHYAYMARFEREATGKFTPAERMAIRAHLGLGLGLRTDHHREGL